MMLRKSAAKRLPLFLPFLLLSMMPGRAEEGAIHWFKDLQQASEAAREANRPMLIDFWADWCAPCKMMDAEIYTNAAVTQTLAHRVVAVRLNFDMQQETARKYNVQTLPHLVFTNSYGTELMHHHGLLNAQDLTAVVNALPANVSELNRLDRVLQEHKNDFEGLLAMGRQLRAAGFLESSNGYYGRAVKQEEARKNPGKREFILREMGLNFLDLKDAKQAAQVFERCLKEFPKGENRPKFLLNLAHAYALSGQKDKARQLLRALIEEFPEVAASPEAQALLN